MRLVFSILGYVCYSDNGQGLGPTICIDNKRLHLDLLVKVIGDRLIPKLVLCTFCWWNILVRKSFRHESDLCLHLSDLVVDVPKVVQSVFLL